MDAALLLWIAVALGIAGIAALRLAWGRPRRSWMLNGCGWVLLLGGSVAAAAGEGAWGLSIMALGAMAAASLALGVAAAGAPRSKGKVSARRVKMLPEAGEPRHLGRRITTFVLTIAGGFVVSLALAIALRQIGMALGWGEANANTLAFVTVPVAWALLVTALLLQVRRRTQLLTLLCASIPAWPVLLGGWA